jgi:predicted nucleic acid-binding protein
MVLVDSSVWIRFLAMRGHEAEPLRGMLQLGQVVGHELVYGELLIGDKGGRGKTLADYVRMSQAKNVPHEVVVRFVRNHGLNGRGVDWIDIHILASAIAGRFQLWTLDTRFRAIAEELGVAYTPPTSKPIKLC